MVPIGTSFPSATLWDMTFTFPDTSELPSASEINDYDKYKNPDWTIIDFPDREVEIERTKKDDLRVTITL